MSPSYLSYTTHSIITPLPLITQRCRGQGPSTTRAAVPTQPASRQPPGSSVLVCQPVLDGRDIAQ